MQTLVASSQISKHLNARQIAGLNRFGDKLIPGDVELPSFSSTGCVRDLDRVLDYMPAQDLADLKMVLTIFAFLPSFAIAFVAWLLGRSASIPTPIGALLRLMNIGFRGLVVTLYFSDARVLKTIGYDVSVYTADLG